jgi:cysteinyl-tRNA synthetase
VSDQNIEPGDCWQQFCDAMDDDFNSARGIGIIFDTIRTINRLLDQHANSDSNQIKKTLQCAVADIRRTGNILGILLENPAVYFNKQQTQVLEQKSVDPAMIDQMVEERNKARKAKNWIKADQIRDQLAGMDVILEDRPEGTVWKIDN